jgi:hypothetical protein
LRRLLRLAKPFPETDFVALRRLLRLSFKDARRPSIRIMQQGMQQGKLALVCQNSAEFYQPSTLLRNRRPVGLLSRGLRLRRAETKYMTQRSDRAESKPIQKRWTNKTEAGYNHIEQRQNA